ncbi:sensor histidine kinase [Bacillus alkalicellulosilyticus]|uniref:sensor histidine kinase n=1 Tax=Alkalihalobacterium alkalicellulosilyticum TaxID=1912214 RepID=UPI00099673DA|nr:sensor histidine kinase [Bacillus alkalicellulosilyticus]
MATKWKNRIILGTLLVLFTFGLGGVLTMINDGPTLIKGDYFETQDFEDELYYFTQLIEYEIQPLVLENIVGELTVSENEISNYRDTIGHFADYIHQIRSEYEFLFETEVISEQDTKLLMEEQEKKIEDITKIFNDDDYVREKILEEKRNTVENYLREVEREKTHRQTSELDFTYFLKDNVTGEIFTNLDSPEPTGIPKNENVLFLKKYPSTTFPPIQAHQVAIYDELGNEIQINQKPKMFTGEVAVLNSSNNFIVEKYYHFKDRQLFFIVYSIITILSVFLFLFFYIKTKEIRTSFLEKWRTFYHRFSIDVRFILLVLTFIFAIPLIVDSSYSYLYYDISYEITRIMKFMFVAPFLGLLYIQGMYLKESAKDTHVLKEEWNKSYLQRFFSQISQLFLNRRVGTQFSIIILLVFACGVGLGISSIELELFLFYLIFLFVIGITIGFAVIKQVGYFNQILNYAKKLHHGDCMDELPVKGRSVLAQHAAHLNAIKESLKASENEQVKSERLKTELITNVSHDLRTPLTSIITYTELLKNQEVDEEERQNYIQIIDRKSKRLKSLIDDLFEVSKMTSGNIELQKQAVDICQLLQQALAEYDETIKKSTLEWRVNKPEHPLVVTVDGQKLWRVFDNLIGNILKYSLENTRVYISVEDTKNSVIITFKNISKYELGGNTEEMLERFKRGDTSRHTEGSGLGLAIAKSIIDLHEGELEIEVDGDLFKVKLMLKN